MKSAYLLSLLASTSSLASGSTLPSKRGLSNTEEAAALIAAEVIRRASPAAPDGYTPKKVDCPSTRPSVRNADGLSQQEQQWLQKRRPNTLNAMRDFLGRLNFTSFDPRGYIDNHQNDASSLPNIAVAASGGGWRALMNGAGGLAAMDSRTPGATGQGQIGGLLDSATYLAGLSGGGWLVGSLFANNYTNVQTIVDSPDSPLWDFQQSILEGPDATIQIFGTVDYYSTLADEVGGKHDAGYNTSLTDYWGRALSFQLINATDGGPAYTFSSIANDQSFTDGNTPMPIVVADGRAPGQVLISANTTVFEFNPWEIGSWDPSLFGFAPLQYAGSKFNGGMLPDNADCIAGFDNLGYVVGTSSTLFNQIVLQFNSTAQGKVPDFLVNAIDDVLQGISADDNDIADWSPNPFLGFNPDNSKYATDDSLTLVDGGEDLQNIPLHPLIQPVRAVDVIFAIDSSADTVYNWPNGTALVATYERARDSTIENGTVFPSIPDQNTIVNNRLNQGPVFFGCDPTNHTQGSQNTNNTPALIVYLPNHFISFPSNVSTFQLTYSDDDRNAIIQNGYNAASQGNGTLDANWPICVGCAMLQRSMMRTNTQVPQECQQCFDRYCWNGQLNSTVPNNTTLTEQNPTQVSLAPAASSSGAAPVVGSDSKALGGLAIAAGVAAWGLL